jgi:ubiquinol-cytochrome c reductase cytochrome b/c1 subunit
MLASFFSKILSIKDQIRLMLVSTAITFKSILQLVFKRVTTFLKKQLIQNRLLKKIGKLLEKQPLKKNKTFIGNVGPVYQKFVTNPEVSNGISYVGIIIPFYIKFNRLVKRPILSFIASHIINYPTPINLTYAWSFGFLAGVSLLIQIFTGLVLSMHYSANIDLAFNSVEHIMRNVNYGWWFRYTHSNGASMFFIVVYAHIIRGLYYGSYMAPRQLLWCSGVVILLLMMATAFMGYVLPWGQMSFWGATVITKMFSVIPFVGERIVEWLWGGFTVNGATLKRFYTMHFVLPFIIAGFVLLHLTLLHKVGSNNPLGTDYAEMIPFYPYYFLKDIHALFIYLLVFMSLVHFYPNLLGHPVNYIPADPMKTPAHIVPEWYFLPYYAILRSIPDKVGGVVCMFGSILILFTVPYTNFSMIRSARFRPIYRVFFWIFVADVFILMWVGQMPMRNSYILLGRYATAYYFLFFLFLLPVSGYIETKLFTHKVTH